MKLNGLITFLQVISLFPARAGRTGFSVTHYSIPVFVCIPPAPSIKEILPEIYTDRLVPPFSVKIRQKTGLPHFYGKPVPESLYFPLITGEMRL
jgi:hypothetical protein